MQTRTSTLLFIPLLILSLTSQKAFSQASIKDSSIFSTLIYANYSYSIPGKDLAKRFGNNSGIGAGLLLKTKSNWLIGVEGNYLFGGKVKNGDDILKHITTSEGYLLDENGMYADYVLYERGYHFLAKFGKMFNWLGPNPNSGFFITAGAGYLQHKVRINIPNNSVPQLEGDYKRGYDRFRGGLAINESIGYLYMGNQRWINFMISLDFTQAWTKSFREYDFDLMKKDDSQHLDLLTGFKIAWFIPVYRRAPKAFYYY
ncbi:MAG: autotransporter outer membrane beta-barrel domain-containing protein [Bacteroidetes bacterium]|nr:autotransporter outer membrane beta-barrel domain-containing protein [Bacteroidota bacterium]